MNATDILKYGDLTVQHSIENIKPELLNKPGACGVWSIKDILAHLTSFEHVLTEVLGTFIGKTTTTYLNQNNADPQKFNDHQVAVRKDKSFDEIHSEYNQVHSQVMEKIAKISHQKLQEVGTLPWYGSEYSLDDYIVYSNYGHKREHTAQIDLAKQDN